MPFTTLRTLASSRAGRRSDLFHLLKNAKLIFKARTVSLAKIKAFGLGCCVE